MAEHAGAAKRRLERRLRQWLRHDRMSVAIFLAESNHHAARRGHKLARKREEVEHVQHEAPRRQEPPLAGLRPGILTERGPQRSDRSLRHSSEDALPTLSLPILAGVSGEAVDSSSLQFLMAAALTARRKEEEEMQHN